MKAAAYIRVSTDRQASEGESLEMQIARAREMCQEHGWELVEIYQDVLSGRKDKRPALARFEKDLRAGKFGAAICYKVDRLGRTRRKLYEILEYIQGKGIRLVSMTQPIDTSTATGRMMLSILVDFAVFEVEQLAERVSDTLLHLAKQGRPVSGASPYGYRYEPNRKATDDDGREVSIPGRLVVVPEDAEGVRYAFERYLALGSLAGAAKALNQQGFRTKTGKPWGVSSVRMLVTNPLYGGERVIRRWPKQGLKKATEASVIRRMGEWVIVPGEHEAIVPVEIARAARAKYQTQKPIPARTRTASNPWSGLVVCGLCGSRMLAYSPGSDRSLAFRCRHRVAQACEATSFSVEWLSVEVVRAVSSVLDASGIVQAAKSSPRKRGKVVPMAPMSHSIDRQVAAKEREISKLDFRFMNDAIDEQPYIDERRRVLAEIEQLRSQSARPASLPPLVLPRPFRETFEALGHGADAVADQKRLLQLLIGRIVVTPERGVVHLHGFSGVELPETVEVARWPAGLKPYTRARWSKNAEACVDCGTTERPHHSRDRCRRCYLRHMGASKREEKA